MNQLKGVVFVLITLVLTIYTHPNLFSSIMSIPTMRTDVAAGIPNEPLTKKALARKKFEGAWEVIRAELLEYFRAEGMPNDAIEWYNRVNIIYMCARLATDVWT